MWKIAATVAAFALLVYALLDAASSQAFCSKYDTTARNLLEKYGEHLHDIEEQVTYSHELWINTETGSFTILSHIGELACIVRSGKLNPKRLREMRPQEDLET